jgi:hypothetical protein
VPKEGGAALCSVTITQASAVAACVQLQQFFTSQLQQEKFLAAKLPPGERTAEQQLHAWYVKRRLPVTLTLCRHSQHVFTRLQNSYSVLLDRMISLLCRADVSGAQLSCCPD